MERITGLEEEQKWARRTTLAARAWRRAQVVQRNGEKSGEKTELTGDIQTTSAVRGNSNFKVPGLAGRGKVKLRLVAMAPRRTFYFDADLRRRSLPRKASLEGEGGGRTSESRRILTSGKAALFSVSPLQVVTRNAREREQKSAEVRQRRSLKGEGTK